MRQNFFSNTGPGEVNIALNETHSLSCMHAGHETHNTILLGRDRYIQIYSSLKSTMFQIVNKSTFNFFFNTDMIDDYIH